MAVDNTDFLVAPATGSQFTLKTSGALDRESLDTYTLQLTTTDGGTTPGPRNSSISCTITVTDINDNDPIFAGSLAATLREDTAVGTSVVTITATDADIGANERLTYEFNSGNDDGIFEIDSATGLFVLPN